MNGHDLPEQFDPIAEFDLEHDQQYLEFNAKIAGEMDAENGYPLGDGLAALTEASAFERQAYVTAYHAAALRKIAMDSGIGWYDIHEVR